MYIYVVRGCLSRNSKKVESVVNLLLAIASLIWSVLLAWIAINPAPLALNVVPWAGSLKEDGYTSIETHSLDDEDMKNVGVKSIKPLYAKPQFIGLTENEILSISADCASSHQHMDIQFAQAIESKLRSKNSG